MTHVEYSRSFPAPVDEVYAVVVPVPLEEVLGRRHLAIPGVARVEQDGVWGRELGQRRTLHFTDGGRTTEVLTVLEAPERFGYELADVTGPMKLLIGGVEGLWSFVSESTGTATRVTWSWEITPTVVGRVAMPVFARMWPGMAAACFDRLGERISARSTG